MNILDLRAAQVAREKDNTKISVLELLECASRHIREGRIRNPVKATLCIIGEDGEKIYTYRCGLTYAEELGYLEMCKDWILRDTYKGS